MSTATPEICGALAEDRHVIIARFLDESVQRANAFLGWAGVISNTFGNRFQPFPAEDFVALLVDCTDTVNELISDLGGTPIVFDNDATGKTEIGVIERCAGFSAEKGGWEMIVNTPALASMPGIARLSMFFEPGEILESYQRAIL